MKWVALLALFCLISLVFSDGSCPSIGESPDFSADLTDVCGCGEDEVSSYFGDNCPQPAPASSLKVNAPTVLAFGADALRLIANNVKAYSTITIQNLFLGVTYEFATNDRSLDLDLVKVPQFDIVLVLRDPFGNVLASNDDCQFYDEDGRFSNSYISYKHVSAKFNTVYLSVYQKAVNARTPGEYLCASKPARGVATIYGGAIIYDGPYDPDNFQCSTKLICKPEVTFDIFDVIDPLAFLESTEEKDLCGAASVCAVDEDGYSYAPEILIDGELVVFEDGYVLEYECPSVGESIVTIQLNGKSCQSTLIVEPETPILECVACSTYTVPRAPFSLCAFSNIEDAYCQFDTSDYVPYVNIVEYEDSCEINIEDLVFDVDYEAFFATIGETVDYSISVTDSTRQVSSEPTTCSVTFLGIQPTTLTQFDQNYEPLPLQRGNVLNIYYDTVYCLDYIASLFDEYGCTDSEIPIDVVFYTGSPSQIETRRFSPHYFRNDGCSDNTLECFSTSCFCIDSTSEEDPIAIGYYSIGLIAVDNWSQTPYIGIDPLNPTAPVDLDGPVKKSLRSTPTCGTEETTTNGGSAAKKRIVGIPELVLSLGNPRVYLDFAPAGNRPDPGTCVEAGETFMWDGEGTCVTEC